MKKTLFLLLFCLLSINSICFAEVKESVSNGRTLQYTSQQTISLDDKLNAQITLTSLAQRTFNFSLDIKLMPKDKDKQSDMFLPDVFLTRTPIFSYWESSNPNDYRITMYDGRSSKKEFYKNGYKVNLTQGEVTNSINVIYVPSNIRVNIGYTFTGDYTKKPIKGTHNWSSNTEFGKFMLNNLKKGNPFALNFIYYYSEVDAVKSENYHRCLINIDGGTMKEWAEVFVKAGF